MSGCSGDSVCKGAHPMRLWYCEFDSGNWEIHVRLEIGTTDQQQPAKALTYMLAAADES